MLVWFAIALAAEVPALEPRADDALAMWTGWVEYQAAINGVPGVSLGAVHGQETLLATGIGLANREEAVPATSSTRYGICSISKLFTSIALVQLRDAGKLSLDDRVSRHLRWFDLAGPDDAPITVRELITHSSGLPRETGLSYWAEPGYPFPTEKELQKQVPTIASLYPPDRYFQYSNFAMSIAGMVVASASKKPYAQYVETQILAPLGLTHTTTALPADLRGKDLAVGYAARDRHAARAAVELYDARGMTPSFGFASNVDDLLLFLKWQLRLRAEGGTDVLSASSLREMQRVQWVDPDWSATWGLGFHVANVDDSTMIGHQGWCPGYRTAIQFDPDSEVGVVVLTNVIDIDPGAWGAEGLELIGPTVDRPLTARDPDLDRYTGVYDHAPHGEMLITRWGNGLGMLWLQTADPSAEVESFVGTDTPGEFRRRRKDGVLGESLVFRTHEQGNVTALVHEDNVIRRAPAQ